MDAASIDRLLLAEQAEGLSDVLRQLLDMEDAVQRLSAPAAVAIPHAHCEAEAASARKAARIQRSAREKLKVERMLSIRLRKLPGGSAYHAV